MPRSAEATQVAATSTNSSSLTLPKTTAPEIGWPQPPTEMAVATPACMIANVLNTAILAAR